MRKRASSEKTLPQPKGNFLMELTDLHFHGSAEYFKFTMAGIAYRALRDVFCFAVLSGNAAQILTFYAQ